MAPLPPGLRAWRILTTAASPFANLLLSRRAARGKEDRSRLQERLGVASCPRPTGRLVWIHGASVGESLAALPLIERLMAGGSSVLVTSGTVTSARILEQRLPPQTSNGQRAIHQYVPLDIPQAVARFLDHWKPDAGLFVESDLWPNLVLAAAQRGMRLALVNARISQRSALGWKRAPKSGRRLIGAFDAVLAQDEEIAARFRALGAHDVRVVGSLKADAPPLPVNEAALEAFRASIAGRPLLLAASTHPGEDEIVLEAARALGGNHAGLLTVIVPRHPQRGGDIEGMAATSGFSAARRSVGALPTPATDVYIADTMGELGLFYRAAPFAFLGGSLVPHGGQVHRPAVSTSFGRLGWNLTLRTPVVGSVEIPHESTV